MSDRNAAKQRRSAQNRREREAREARVARARSASGEAAPAAGGRGRTPAPPVDRRTVRATARRERWTDSASPNPGARMVFLSVLLAIAAAVMLYLLPIVPVEEEGTREVVTQSLAEAEDGGPRVVPFLLVPVLIAASAWFATRWTGRRRRRAWVAGAILQWVCVMLYQTLGLLYLVSAVALAVGAWQSVQAGRREAIGADGTDVEIDEGDEIDEHDQIDEDEADEDDEASRGPIEGGSLGGRINRWRRPRS